MITIRKATEEDAEAIAFVHVTAWQETYKGMMPAAILDHLSVNERSDCWRRILSTSSSTKETRAFVAIHPVKWCGWLWFLWLPVSC